MKASRPQPTDGAFVGCAFLVAILGLLTASVTAVVIAWIVSGC